MTELRLYSPIRLYEKLPYEPPWTDTGEDVRTLSPAEARECRETVCEAMQHCLTPEEQKNGLATGMDSVLTAFPTAEADENGLTAVLVCRCSRELLPEELDALSDWWDRECQYGYGKRLKHSGIRVKGIGSVAVKLSEHGGSHAFCAEMEVSV